MHLTPLQLGDPDNPIRIEFFRVEPPPTRLGDVLVMKFSGVYRIGCQGNPDAAFMSAMQLAAVQYWDPRGTVLDLRDLDYRWGDMMDIVRAPRLARWQRGAHAVVVGPKCRDAIATLMFGVETTKRATDQPGYFDSDLDSAIAYVIDRLPRWRTESLLLHPPENRVFDDDAPPMTEAQWLASRDPGALLRWAVWRVPPRTPAQMRAADEAELSGRGALDAIMRPAGADDDWSTITPATERRMLLLVVACLRRVSAAMTDARTRRAVDVAERLADGTATFGERDDAKHAAMTAHAAMLGDDPAARPGMTPGHELRAAAALAVVFLEWPDQAAAKALDALPRPLREGERAAQADLVRDLFGNPFRPPPAIDPRLRTDDVVRLAHAIYEEHAFARLPALADALERAACTDGQILAHLRHPGPHGRGCHVLDIILGRS